jgi:HMG-box domain
MSSRRSRRNQQNEDPEPPKEIVEKINVENGDVEVKDEEEHEEDHDETEEEHDKAEEVHEENEEVREEEHEDSEDVHEENEEADDDEVVKLESKEDDDTEAADDKSEESEKPHSDPPREPTPDDKHDDDEEPDDNDDVLAEEKGFSMRDHMDPELLQQIAIINAHAPTSQLELALVETLKRKDRQIERLSGEITKLKTFISKRKQTYKRKRKDEGAPTRALSAYNIFVQDRFAKLSKENEQALKSSDSDAQLKRVPPASLVATTGNQWKELSSDDKTHYEDR